MMEITPKCALELASHAGGWFDLPYGLRASPAVLAKIEAGTITENSQIDAAFG